MGNIRTKNIKKASFQFIEAYPDRFTRDFEKNKDALNELNLIHQKLLRNKVAGYITRIMTRGHK
ncbi:30S ribosomal protein S17e [Candidatus Woesearchaeota archaeon]|nr:30S ribosomal protein S17e [Candidatus Woesearchaeota archaeon]